MNLRFIKDNLIKRKFLIIGLSTTIAIIAPFLGAFLFFPAFYALIWVIPISLGFLFLETKLHLIPDTYFYKKKISLFFNKTKGLIRKSLLYSLYLVLGVLWIVLISVVLRFLDN